jgi:predicted hydrocarbon binding protein
MDKRRHTKKTHEAKAKQRQKKTTNKAKTVKKQYRGLVNASPIYQPSADQDASYEETVIKNIVGSGKGGNVADEALLMSSTLSSLSGSMREMQYKKGFSSGRALFKMMSATKRYTFPEEAVADLVEFFQAAGRKHVTYDAFPDSVTIRIHGSGPSPEVGASLHTFEAGIISGFLSSAEHHLVNVTESSCINNNGNYCRFTTNAPEEARRDEDSPSIIDRLAAHVASEVSTKGKANFIKDGYYLLESSALFDKSSIEPVKSIASYFGRSVAEHLPANNARARSVAMLNAIRLLNLGNPKLVASRPLHMKLSFEGSSSREELVGVSLAFINGMLSNSMKKDAVAVERNSHGSYIVDIRERG